MELPSSRTEWASLEWKDAQIKLAYLLKNYRYMVFEEKHLESHARADIMVILKEDNRLVFGIIEVKSYQNITSKLEQNAFRQACKYLREVYSHCENVNIWGKKPRRYFIATVFTNDYPSNFSNHNLDRYKRYLPKKLVRKENIDFISTTPGKLIQKLQRRKLASFKQSKIEDFF